MFDNYGLGPNKGYGPLMSYQNGENNPNGFLNSFQGWGNQQNQSMVTPPNGMDFWGRADTTINAGSALLSGFLGLKQYGLAKDQFNFSKDAFQKNYANQVQTTNTKLEDRQRARVASNPDHFQSVEEYMKNNRVG